MTSSKPNNRIKCANVRYIQYWDNLTFLCHLLIKCERVSLKPLTFVKIYSHVCVPQAPLNFFLIILSFCYHIKYIAERPPSFRNINALSLFEWIPTCGCDKLTVKLDLIIAVNLSGSLKVKIFQAYKQLLKLLFTATIKVNLTSITAVHVYDSFHMQFPSINQLIYHLYRSNQP